MSGDQSHPMFREQEAAPAEQDPWKHRSAGMRCASCMWFVKKETVKYPDKNDDRGDLGRCRRRAPTMNGYPATFEADWCGDHKLDETKL